MFPLPLTNFEEYMLRDDRPAYPMTGIYRLRFAGFLERAAFEAALTTAVQRHPFLRATVRHTRGRRPVWVDHPDWHSTVQWQANVNPRGVPSMAYLDLTEKPGFRWWVVDRDDGHDVIVQAHHCCVDGAGINQVVEDLLIGYALNQGSADNVSLRQLDPQRLLRRSTPKLTTGKFLKMAHKQLFGLIGVRDFLMHTPVPLMDGTHEIDPTATPNTFPSIRTHEFDPGETKKIGEAAKRFRVTANELLVRDLFLTVSAWRKKQPFGNDQDRIRFSIPFNLRAPADKQMPMCNSISMVFLDRRVADCTYPVLLLRGIHKQMWIIKRFQLQYTYILSVGASRFLPGAMSWMASADRCFATSYLSNLGVVLDQIPLPYREGRVISGNVELESVEIVSVLRPHTHAGFTAYTYAGRLRISIHYDSRVISAEQSGELLDMYVQRIRRTIQNVVGNG